MVVKAKQLTAEQRLIGDMQRLQSSKGFKYIVERLQEDKEALIKQLVYDFKGQDVDKEFSTADIWRYRIELIEDILTMPQKIINEYDPLIETDTPHT